MMLVHRWAANQLYRAGLPICRKVLLCFSMQRPAWAVGSYSISQSAGGTPQIMICKTSRQIESPALYNSVPKLESFTWEQTMNFLPALQIDSPPTRIHMNTLILSVLVMSFSKEENVGIMPGRITDKQSAPLSTFL